MELLITEVTEMSTGNICVAGWCHASQKMVRPLPNGANWNSQQIREYGIAPGKTVLVEPITLTLHGEFPHLTEDTPITPTCIKITDEGPAVWLDNCAPPVATTLSKAFEGNLHVNSEWNGIKQGAYISLGVHTRSLWGLSLSGANLTFIEDRFSSGEPLKLKGILDDSTAKYKLPVTSLALKELWRARGIDAVNSSIPKSRTIHVRVGLARAYSQHPDKCFIMLNGVHW